MSNDMLNPIGTHQRGTNLTQVFILTIVIRRDIGSFQLNTDGKIVAPLTAMKAGFSGMPGASIKRDKLDQRTVSPDEQMTADSNPLEIRQRIGACVQRIGKEGDDFRTAKLAGRKTDAMDNDQRYLVIGTLVLVRTEHLFRLGQLMVIKQQRQSLLVSKSTRS